MLPISASELAQIQSDTAAAACDQTCVIKRKSVTKDAYGSETETFNTIATVKAGLTEPTGTQLQNFEYRIGSLKAWKVVFPVGTDAAEQDHLIIGGKTLVAQVDLVPRSFPALLAFLASEVE